MDTKLALTLYQKMLQLREFELKVQELYRRGLLPGFVHLYVGEEAVAVGVCANLQPTDLVYSTHRGHGHALAKGVPGREVMAELDRKSVV
jgi:TPP-dependent pyruvate/acetoin dehydrogenase alpha subunit